ncbi:UNVERIFIED_CONTAM: hypothetical protein Sradi_0220400 [Sesamum radiatum]|uniref:Uncharacterized protein n=1 Tax=Sesamum radiatum TaxID=300843 RepID=A0AAW2W1S5_SESRA
MANGTRLKELQEAQIKTNLFLVDERVRRQVAEEQTHTRLDQVIEVRDGLQSTVMNIKYTLVTVQQ